VGPGGGESINWGKAIMERLVKLMNELAHSSGTHQDFVGCMFSGKTEEMMRRVRRAGVRNRKIVIFTPEVDWRGGKEAIYSHAQRLMPAIAVDYHSEEILKKVKTLMKEMEIYGVAIDETQFFDENLPEVAKELKRKFERVLTAHLNFTFDGRPFPFRSSREFEEDSDTDVGALMKLAEKIYTLDAVCTYKDNGEICGSEEAVYSQRIVRGEVQTIGPTILIGEGEYEARCADHIIYPPGVNAGKFLDYLEQSI